ncbi:hypothetical protein BGZ57DRAFT_926959 [Hyaloscypha finlandica]|nr:hypothetical protein BGZ57DRAFT_926959 [Hyaloscypha finlandica]
MAPLQLSKLFISLLTYIALPITAQTNTTLPATFKPASISTTLSISISSEPTATFTTITSTISSLISTTPLPTTLTTSSLIQTTSSSPAPAPTHAPPPKYTIPTTPLYIGISFALLAFALLIFFLLCLESFLYRRRQRANLLSRIPPNPHDGLRTLHLPELVHKTRRKYKRGDRRSRLEFQDGRRFGVVGLDLDNGDGKVGVQSKEQGKKNREAFEAWKNAQGFGTDWRDEDIRDEETVEESADDRGRKRERRETFDAWKKGVVPPLKAEEEEFKGMGDKDVGSVGVELYTKTWGRRGTANTGRVVQDPGSENPSAEVAILAVGRGFPRHWAEMERGMLRGTIPLSCFGPRSNPKGGGSQKSGMMPKDNFFARGEQSQKSSPRRVIPDSEVPTETLLSLGHSS